MNSVISPIRFLPFETKKKLFLVGENRILPSVLKLRRNQVLSLWRSRNSQLHLWIPIAIFLNCRIEVKCAIFEKLCGWLKLLVYLDTDQFTSYNANFGVFFNKRRKVGRIEKQGKEERNLLRPNMMDGTKTFYVYTHYYYSPHPLRRLSKTNAKPGQSMGGGTSPLLILPSFPFSIKLCER